MPIIVQVTQSMPAVFQVSMMKIYRTVILGHEEGHLTEIITIWKPKSYPQQQ